MTVHDEIDSKSTNLEDESNNSRDSSYGKNNEHCEQQASFGQLHRNHVTMMREGNKTF